MTERRLEVITTWVKNLAIDEAASIVSSLTKPGSEFQHEVNEHRSDTRIAVVKSEGKVVAWAATHEWAGKQTLEGFTAIEHRRRGLSRLAASALVADRSIIVTLPIAVFSPYCVSIAKSVGCRDVRVYLNVSGQWIDVTTLND